MPTIQRRSKPVNGRVLALAASLLGALLASGDAAFVGVEVVGLLSSFEGEVPVLGLLGSWL